jgi:hypothetical protein
MKKLLLAGALSLAGATALYAQTVTSINAVGYANVTIAPGFSMIGNQLNTSDNRLSSILPDPLVGTRIFKWNGASFSAYDYVQLPPFLGGGKKWDPDGNATLNPGEGAFIFNPATTNVTLTFVGEVVTDANSNISIPSGFAIISSPVPQSAALTTTLLFPAAPGDRVFRYNGTSYTAYDYITVPPFLGGGTRWDPSEPTPNVGEAFFSFKVSSTPTPWNRNFTIN